MENSSKTLLCPKFRFSGFCFSFLAFTCCFLFFASVIFAAEPPTSLTTDLLEHTDRVFLDGYPANFSLEECHAAIERYQLAAIRSTKPFFGWVMNDDNPNTLQTAYRILEIGRAHV